MKRFVVFVSIVLWISLVCAQSNTPHFIDSPSWVLAQEKSSEQMLYGRKTENPGKPEAQVASSSARPSGAESAQNAGKTLETGAGKGKKSPVGSAPKKEGFLHVGVYVAPVFNWLSSINEPYKRSGVNVCVTPTVMFDMRLFRRLYVGVGAAFNTFGGRVGYPDEGNLKHERSYMFSYVEIPVRIKWQTRNFADSKGSLFLSGGVNLGFGVSYKYKDIYKGPFPTSLGVLDGVFKSKGKMMKNDRRLANLAAVAQFGYNYQIRPRVNLIVGLEYHYGFVRPVKKGKQLDGLGKPVYNNQQFGLILGIMF